jgi:hypothetical protein
LALLKRHGFDLLCIFLYFPVFSANTRSPPRAAARAARATKNPPRHAARAPGVVSVNIFFWKILVTRVKRKIELPLSPEVGFSARAAREPTFNGMSVNIER